MTLEQLTSRYFRLQQELSIAYQQRPWHSGRIDRLARDIATTEREIGGLQSSQRGQSPARGNFGAAA